MLFEARYMNNETRLLRLLFGSSDLINFNMSESIDVFSYTPPTPDEWKEEILRDVEELEFVPLEFVHEGPTYKMSTKTGHVFQGETKIVDQTAFLISIHGAAAVAKFTKHKRGFLIAKNELGDVVGTQTVEIRFNDTERINVSSYVRVLEKNKGLGSALGETFIQFLQYIADHEQKIVRWRPSNINGDHLREYEARPDADPEKLREMREEQERWVHLFDDGGKFGIKRGIRDFIPAASK